MVNTTTKMTTTTGGAVAEAVGIENLSFSSNDNDFIDNNDDDDSDAENEKIELIRSSSSTCSSVLPPPPPTTTTTTTTTTTQQQKAVKQKNKEELLNENDNEDEKSNVSSIKSDNDEDWEDIIPYHSRRQSRTVTAAAASTTQESLKEEDNNKSSQDDIVIAHAIPAPVSSSDQEEEEKKKKRRSGGSSSSFLTKFKQRQASSVENATKNKNNDNKNSIDDNIVNDVDNNKHEDKKEQAAEQQELELESSGSGSVNNGKNVVFKRPKKERQRVVDVLTRYDEFIKLANRKGITEEMIPVILYSICSFLMFVSALAKREFFVRHFGYAVTVGVLGMCFSIGVLILMKFKNDDNKINKETSAGMSRINTNDDAADGNIEIGLNETTASSTHDRDNGDDENEHEELPIVDRYRWLFNAILFVWSFFGTLILTFGRNDVYRKTGNGYFSIWMMLISSIWNCGITYEMIEKELLSNADSCVYGLSLTSMILIAELSAELNNLRRRGDSADAGEDEVGGASLSWENMESPNISLYVLILSVFSLTYGFVTAGLSRLSNDNIRIPNPKLRSIFIIVLSILWIVAASLSTFIGPYDYTGNGYFAAWGSVLCTFFAYIDTKQEIESLYI